MAYETFILTKTAGMTKDIKLFTEFKENWQYFFTETAMVPHNPGSTDKVLTIKAHKRLRGPGDPNPIDVKQTQRFYARVAKTKGSARPGFEITVGEKNGSPAATRPWRELRQFSILGNLMDLDAYIRSKAKMQITVWGPNGWHETVPAAGSGGAITNRVFLPQFAHDPSAAPAPVITVP